MQGKEIIAFFGSTGSGKSTTVNYFVGHELEIKKNKFGEQVVHLVESESKSSAKIGHSIGTSETIFSEGLPLLQEKFDQESDVFPKLQNAIMCDNPGFHDTRGSDYEICTNLSIDRAMQCAKMIRAIVLVMPYDTFTLDRANHVVHLIGLMQERFPEILSKYIESFYIIISKSTNHEQQSSFQERLERYLKEDQDQIGQMTQSDPKDLKLDFMRQRMQIFRALHWMN